MSRFILFVTAVLAIGGQRGYSQAELLGFVFEATALYAVLGTCFDRPLRKWWGSTKVHKVLVAWFTRAIDGAYNLVRRKSI